MPGSSGHLTPPIRRQHYRIRHMMYRYAAHYTHMLQIIFVLLFVKFWRFCILLKLIVRARRGAICIANSEFIKQLSAGLGFRSVACQYRARIGCSYELFLWLFKPKDQLKLHIVVVEAQWHALLLVVCSQSNVMNKFNKASLYANMNAHSSL